jgi:hypothetical protein
MNFSGLAACFKAPLKIEEFLNWVTFEVFGNHQK